MCGTEWICNLEPGVNNYFTTVDNTKVSRRSNQQLGRLSFYFHNFLRQILFDKRKTKKYTSQKNLTVVRNT